MPKEDGMKTSKSFLEHTISVGDARIRVMFYVHPEKGLLYELEPQTPGITLDFGSTPLQWEHESEERKGPVLLIPGSVISLPVRLD